MSERRVTEMMERHYNNMIADVDTFGDMQSSAHITPEGFEAMRQEVLSKIRQQRRFLKECESQVKLLHPIEQKEIPL